LHDPGLIGSEVSVAQRRCSGGCDGDGSGGDPLARVVIVAGLFVLL
jgi:hypothetical protein